MPNSAYLYASDEPDDWETRTDGAYCDSRWVLPLAWLFFFRPEDIRLITVSSGNSNWLEIKFTAEKRGALALFERRKRLLLALIHGRSSRRRINEFVSTLGARPGRFLIIEPGEVVEDDLHASERYVQVLQVLDSTNATVDEIRSVIRGTPHVNVEAFSPDDRVSEGQILGYGA